MSKAAFLVRAGKPCALELSAPVSMARLLQSVFEDYLQSVSAKMASWKVPGTVNAAGGPQLAQDTL